MDHTQFALFIEAARVIYRAHPGLITAEEVSEPYRSVLEAFNRSHKEYGTDCRSYGCTICKHQDEDDENGDEEEEEEEEPDVPLADAHSSVSETVA